MATKPKVKTLTNSSVDVLNAIRHEATINYQNKVPIATADADSIRTIGAVIMDSVALQNEFISALVNRIGRIMVSSRLFDNPLKMYLSDIFTVSANLAGLPAISFPCGNDSSGMPVGVQIIGKSMDDVKVLNAAHAYQKLTDFHKNFAEVK